MTTQLSNCQAATGRSWQKAAVPGSWIHGTLGQGRELAVRKLGY
jgi:hypothetical protein